MENIVSISSDYTLQDRFLADPQAFLGRKVNGHSVREAIGPAFEDGVRHFNLINAIGVPWDGVSDLTATDHPTISAHDASQLLAVVSKELACLADPLIQPLEAQSLRRSASTSGRPRIVIEVDLGGVVLPFSNSDISLHGATSARIDQLACDIAYHVNAEWKHCGRLLARQAKAESSLEKAMLRFGPGCRPIWLRMNPISADDPKAYSRSRSYDWVLEVLDDELRPSITGEIGANPTQIHKWIGPEARHHRRRLKMRENIRSAGAKGAMESVALALIKLRGRDPVEVLDNLLERARLVSKPVLTIHSEGESTEIVYFHNGIVASSISFEGGHYSKGSLILFGKLPHVYLATAKGKQLTEIVDHPAFALSGVTVARVESRDGACDFDHNLKVQFIGG